MLLGRTLRALPATWRYRRKVFEQLFEIGNASLLMACILSLFIGGVIALQSGPVLRERGLVSALGGLVGLSLCKELAPVMMAVLISGRIGSAMAAEIGSMVVTEQVDALRMCAADPIDYLIVPRFKASIIMTTMLVVLAACVAYCTGMYTAYAFFEINPKTFMNMSLVDVGDLSIGLAKCLAYGAAIPVVSGYCGLSTFGGSEGVGWATTGGGVGVTVRRRTRRAATASALTDPTTCHGIGGPTTSGASA